MRVLYHHRTRATDAQRIHILEIIRAFQAAGCKVEEAALVSATASVQDAARDAGEASWKTVARKIPGAYDLLQLGYNLVGAAMLLSRALRFRPHFIYERYTLHNFAGALVSGLLRIPLVLEVNSPFALEMERDKDIHWPGLAKWSERTICNAADLVVVVSTPLKRIMAAAGVDERRMEVMPNGVDLEHFGDVHPEEGLRASLGLDGRRVVGFVGWFRKWHGLEMLVEAFDRSGLAREDVRLLLVGDGPAMSDLRQEVDRRGLHDAVVFSGPVTHEQVPRYAALFDAAVQPAANEYCCPMKILEYMGMGKAVVAPRQENITELLREPDEAEYFRPGDPEEFARALGAVMRQDERRAALGRNARAAVDARGYKWSANAERVLARVRRS
jgi:glycosyltransferase involved in cell wall biosynthesis